MKKYLPPQHGAWAFLALPVVLGASAMRWTPLVLFLALAWLAAYPLSYAALGLVRSPHPDRFRRPFVVWLAIVAPAALALVIVRPWLAWVGAAYGAVFTINLGYARRHDERALLNNLVFVVECSAMVVVTAALAEPPARSWRPSALVHVAADAWVLSAVCALVLIGSTLHVKSLIRERRNPRYAHAARVFAMACVPVAVAVGLPRHGLRGAVLAVPFVVLAIRTFAGPGPGSRPGRIGMVELAGFVVVAVVSATWA